MPKLIVSKNCEFFVAICKKREHSFVIFGVHDKEANKNHILCGVGKYFLMGEDASSMMSANCSNGLSFLFDEERGELYTEFYSKDGKICNQFRREEIDISYSAYRISLENYLEFIFLLNHSKRFNSKQTLRGYDLDKSEGPNLEFEFYKFVTRDKPLSEENAEKLKKIDGSARSVSMGNSCRHTALMLVEMVIKEKQISVVIMQWSFQTIHVLLHERIRKELIYFPVPPPRQPAKKEEMPQHRVMVRLYRQLQTLSSKFLDNEVTYEKFYALRALYDQLDSRKDRSIFEVFEHIHAWDSQNASLIDTKRGFPFFFTTATRDMLNEFNEMESVLLTDAYNSMQKKDW